MGVVVEDAVCVIVLVLAEQTVRHGVCGILPRGGEQGVTVAMVTPADACRLVKQPGATRVAGLPRPGGSPKP